MFNEPSESRSHDSDQSYADVVGALLHGHAESWWHFARDSSELT